MKSKILVVDDEKSMCETLKAILESDDYEVCVRYDAKSGMDVIRHESVNAVITDVRMSGMDGLQLLEEIKVKHPSLPVLLITAYGNMKAAVDALKRGAFDYLAKPFDPDELLMSLKKALEYENLVLENKALKEEIFVRYRLCDLIGESQAIRELKDIIIKVAPTDSRVLIEGESGTGKEIVAHSLHYHSRRASLPFVAVNCAQFTETLLESELFGHEKGSFTGADEQKKGKFEIADKGTLYLDEIGDMSLALQSKLLRVIEDQNFYRVGGSKPVRADVRIIAATNKNLGEAIKKGLFRDDLYYRIKGINIKLPPLRERSGDVAILADYFERKFCEKIPARKSFRLGDKILARMKEYHWPGNVRELENGIERAVILDNPEAVLAGIEAPGGQDERYGAFTEKPYYDAVDDFKRFIIERAFEKSQRSMNKTAEKLGVTRKALYYQMESLGMRKTDDPDKNEN